MEPGPHLGTEPEVIELRNNSPAEPLNSPSARVKSNQCRERAPTEALKARMREIADAWLRMAANAEAEFHA